jgi:DNA-binding transcriptional MerR regulator/transcriptional regulator with XRE-family HTH domain
MIDDAAREAVRITDAAREVGVSSSAIRLWERQGLIRPFRGRDGARRYTPADVARLRTIHRLRHADGLNAAAIRRLLPPGATDRPGSGVAPVEAIARDPRLAVLPPRSGGGRSRRPSATRLGPRLRAARLGCGLTLRAAAAASGLSASFVSAVERGLSGASLSALKRLTAAYGTTLAVLLRGPAMGAGRLVQADARRVAEPGGGIRIEDLATTPTQLESQLFVLAPGASSDGYYAHPGEEFMFVLDGRLGVWLDEAEYYELGPGDALTFPSTLDHRFEALGTAETRLVWVNTPPTF